MATPNRDLHHRDDSAVVTICRPPSPVEQIAPVKDGLRSIDTPNDRLDEERSGLSQCGLERGQKAGRSIDPDAFDAHAFSQMHPIEMGIVESQHAPRIGTGIAHADIPQFAFEDPVGAIGEEDGDDVEALARLGPQALHGIHAAAVRLHADHLAAGAGKGRAGRKGNADTDRTACDRQEIVRPRAMRLAEEGRRRGQGLVADDSALRHQPRHDGRDGFGCQRPVGHRPSSWAIARPAMLDSVAPTRSASCSSAAFRSWPFSATEMILQSSRVSRILRASDGREIDASDARQVMGVLFASRVRAGASFLDMEARSGISAKSAYAWLNGRRQPALANLAAWAQSLGFDLIMRRAPESTTEKRSA
jgi:hypothetical protein